MASPVEQWQIEEEDSKRERHEGPWQSVMSQNVLNEGTGKRDDNRNRQHGVKTTTTGTVPPPLFKELIAVLCPALKT